jgi:gamma-glutamyltranspeptidase / glutathione hydrolase
VSIFRLGLKSRWASLIILASICVAACQAMPAHAGGRGGALAVSDSYGADTAERILSRGGNAVDAAVAVAFTLAVTFPEAGNIGGGGFATVFFNGQPYFLDYRECAPSRARADMYLDASGAVVSGASTIGAAAAGVPGTVAGMWELHRRFGRLPWSSDLAPAIRYAHEGFVVSPKLVEYRNNTAAVLAGRTNFERYFGALKSGQTFRQPELEASLRLIAAEGTRAFYSGRTADLIAEDMTRNGGYITGKDLADYRPVWRAPLIGDWAGYKVITAPLPSSGGIALLSLLEMKQDLAPAFSGVPQNSPQYVHLLAEIEKRVFADRAQYLGDPAFYPGPVKELLDPKYLAGRAALVNVEHPTPTQDVKPGLTDHHNTTHFSIIDRWGNAVSNTYTLNDYFGSGEVIAGAGFLMNNEMDDFSAKPGSPNLDEVVGGDANAIAPGKRPLSTMTPTILTSDGKVAVIIGTPGGSRIATSIFQVLTNWHDFHMPLRDAVAVPRIHHQLLPPDTLFEEPYAGLDPGTKKALIERGYKFAPQGWNGDIQVIAIGTEGTTAVSDPRGRGVARVLH